MNTIIIGIRVGHVGIHYNETGVHLVIFHLVFSSFFFPFLFRGGDNAATMIHQKRQGKTACFQMKISHSFVILLSVTWLASTRDKENGQMGFA